MESGSKKGIKKTSMEKEITGGQVGVVGIPRGDSPGGGGEGRTNPKLASISNLEFWFETSHEHEGGSPPREFVFSTRHDRPFLTRTVGGGMARGVEDGGLGVAERGGRKWEMENGTEGKKGGRGEDRNVAPSRDLFHPTAKIIFEYKVPWVVGWF